MTSRYRRVLGLPGAMAFSLSGLVGRLPLSMVSLGIVVLVSAQTGSYALAGSVSASYLIATALFAVLQARLIDRHGQSRVLPWAVTGFALGLTAMTVAVQLGAPAPVPHLFAALAGAAQPQIGASVRARWTHLVPDKLLLRTAFAVEAVADEVVFIVGPVLVTSLATLVEPVAGLAAAILAGVGGTVALVLQRRTEPPPARHLGAHGVGPMGWPVLGPLALSMFTLGALFGGAEVTAVAVSASLGHKGYSGALLAIWSLGSLVAGVVVGALPVRAANGTRYRWGLLTLGLLLTPLPFVHGFGLLGVFLLLAGFAIAPTLIASIALVEETVPPGRLNEGISIVTTGLNAGLAPGAAVAGAVIDRAGASAAFWVSSGAGLLGAAIAFGAEPVMRLSRRAPSPSGSSE